jgi:hypothetical protein
MGSWLMKSFAKKSHVLVPSKETIPNVLADSRPFLRNFNAMLGFAELLKVSLTTSVSEKRTITF